MNLTNKQLSAISARLIGCPFCGSSDVHMMTGEEGRIRIECDNSACMATVSFHAGALFAPSLSLSRWNSRKMKKTGFEPPTLEEVEAYCKERRNGIKPQSFIDYYEARDWKLHNGCKVKDWKALVRRWEDLEKKRSPTPKTSSIDLEEVEKIIRTPIPDSEELDKLMKEVNT